jgi:hypothetical protein
MLLAGTYLPATYHETSFVALLTGRLFDRFPETAVMKYLK